MALSGQFDIVEVNEPSILEKWQMYGYGASKVRCDTSHRERSQRAMHFEQVGGRFEEKNEAPSIFLYLVDGVVVAYNVVELVRSWTNSACQGRRM